MQRCNNRSTEYSKARMFLDKLCWQRFIQLCEGNDEIIIMGNADTGKMRLIAEIDKKARVAQGEIALKAS